MTAKIIDGKQVAADMRAELKAEVAELAEKGIVPGLAVVLVGEDPASKSYVTAKERACEELGIYSDDNRLAADTPQKDLMALIDKLNKDPKINGILVQLPLPDGLNEAEVLLAIDPAKDVDGFHPVNVGKMVVGEKAFLPCTPHGVIQLLIRNGVKLEGAEVVIVGRSNIVGKPLANMLIQKNAPDTVTADMVKDGVVVIDVGVNRVGEKPSKKDPNRMVAILKGDVDFEAVKEKASLITPVPGGVGPMTITMLLYNTVESAKRAAGIDEN
jgi:methylenetetrahydrofolate dehydrogenase (NADP+)/methenyltetrahydrofolate cyclohydrolase